MYIYIYIERGELLPFIRELICSYRDDLQAVSHPKLDCMQARQGIKQHCPYHGANSVSASIEPETSLAAVTPVSSAQKFLPGFALPYQNIQCRHASGR